MAFELEERPDGPDVTERDTDTTVSVKYVFRGTNDYAVLRQHALDMTPTTIEFGGKTLGRSGWQPRFQPGEWGYLDVIYDSRTTEDQAIQPEGGPGDPGGSGGGSGGGGDTPTFPTPSDSDTLDSSWTLTTRGGTAHVVMAKEMMAFGDGGTVNIPDAGNVIGVTKNGVKGADVPAIKVTASITIPTNLNLPLIRTLVRIDEPKTNDAPWLGLDAGEWLYVGCDAQGSGSTGRGTLTIHLEGGENIYQGDPRADVNDSLTLPTRLGSTLVKGAHEYVDFYYSERDVGSTTMPVAIGAYVYRMFDSMSFSDAFGFG